MSTMRMRVSINKTTWTDLLFTFLIAVAPILQHYNGVVMNAGVTVLILALPYVLIKTISKTDVSPDAIKIILPLFPFLLFKVVDHGTYAAEYGQVIIVIIYAFAFSSKKLSTDLFIRIATFVSCAASFIIVIQYFCYYVLGFHLRIVPVSMLLSSADQWVKLAQTGRIGITGRVISFYRPSAFFLEPSHMFLYLFGPLLFNLLSPHFARKQKIISIIISVGMVLSTSGMGIGVTFASWLLYLGRAGGKDNRLSFVKLFRPRNILILIGIIIVVITLYNNFSFFRHSIGRVFSKGSLYGSAVSGRVALGGALVRRMGGKQLLIGVSDRYSGLDFNMSGFNGTMYKYGVVGTALSYFFYLKAMIDLRDQYFWISLVLIIISFFTAHTHGTFYMLFFTILLIDGYVDGKGRRDYSKARIRLKIGT